MDDYIICQFCGKKVSVKENLVRTYLLNTTKILIIKCPHCGKKNRIPEKYLYEKPAINIIKVKF